MNAHTPGRRPSPAPLAFISLGSNLGDSAGIIRDALRQLQALNPLPSRASSLWRSSPVDCPAGSFPFINAVVGLEVTVRQTPEALLAKLQAMERSFGRPPKVVYNEPRLLDLDLVAFGQETRKSTELTLPHPRAHLRRFVLAPLAEIAPNYKLPGQTATIQELLKNLNSNQDVFLLI